MDTIQLPLGKVYKGGDEVELREDSALIMDAFLTEKGAFRRRPGFTLAFAGRGAVSDPKTPIEALYWNPLTSILFIACGTNIKGVRRLAEGVYGDQIVGGPFPGMTGLRPIFTSDGTYTFMANGNRIVVIPTDNTIAPYLMPSPLAPTHASHVVWIDSFLVANQVGTNRFFWSDDSAPLDWNGENTAQASGSPDPIIAMHVRNRELYLFGKTSLEVWVLQELGFERIDGGYIEAGCGAPYSILLSKSGIYWLDNERQFVRWQGRNMPERISTPYDREIERFSAVNDCTSSKFTIDGNELLLFSFPSANKTLVYNTVTDSWSEFGRFNGAGGYDRYLGSCAAYCDDWLRTFIGSRVDDSVYVGNRDIYTDDGMIIRSLWLTGHLDQGSHKWKRNSELRIRAKRGNDGSLMVRWRDNKKSSWSDLKTLSLGTPAETQLIFKLSRLGIYRTRQYEFSITDPVPFEIVMAEEDLEVLR